MGRLRRVYLPGGIFHVAARTIRRERRFTPRLRSAAVTVLVEALPRSGARLLAVAIMSNHLHLVVQQGKRPVQVLMQLFLRRLALLLQHAHGIEGPVFWRPYASVLCADPSHARNAVAYAHLNPVRAGLCDDPADYKWTSHSLYAGVPMESLPGDVARLRSVLDPAHALPLFATGRRRSLAQLAEDYRTYLAYRLAADGNQRNGDLAALPAFHDQPPPWIDDDWGAELSPLFQPQVQASGPTAGLVQPVRPDLAVVAQTVMAREAPGVPIDAIRGGSRGGAARTRLRYLVIRRLHDAGYPNVQIAVFLDISESTVSYAIRRGRAEP